MLCFKKILVAKKIIDKKKGVKSQFSVEKFLSHSTKTFRRGTILCCVSENIWWRKSLWIRRGGEYHIFPSNFFSHSAEKLRSGTLKPFIHFGYRIKICFRGL